MAVPTPQSSARFQWVGGDTYPPGGSADPLQAVAKAHIGALAAVRADQQRSGEAASAQPPPAAQPATPPRAATSDGSDTPAFTARRFDFNQNPGSEEQQGYQDKSDALARERAQELTLSQQEQQAIADAGRAAAFNKDAYTNKRLAEMQPTADIDDAILKLRQRAVYDQASLWEQLQGVPLPKAMEVMNGRQSEYARQIQDLAKMRETRLTDAKSKIDEEVGTYQGQIEASKTKLEGIKAAIDTAKASGATEASMAQLHIDAAKEEARLNKTRASKNGLGTSDETAIAYIAATNNLPKSKATEIWKAAKSQGTTDYKNIPSALLPKGKLADEPLPDFIKRISEHPESMTTADYAKYLQLKKSAAASQ